MGRPALWTTSPDGIAVDRFGERDRLTSDLTEEDLTISPQKVTPAAYRLDDGHRDSSLSRRFPGPMAGYLDSNQDN
ncbi:MAG: hypothetical protein ACK5H2_06090 [Beutenbergiaceae bacterium]